MVKVIIIYKVYLSIGSLKNCSHSYYTEKSKKCVHFFDSRCKDKYKTNFLLSNNAQKFILQSRSSKIGDKAKG